MLEYFRGNGRNGDTSIVCDITLVAMRIFDEWQDRSMGKLERNEGVNKHGVEKLLKASKDDVWSIEKVFCTYVIIVLGFPAFKAHDGVDGVIYGYMISVTVTCIVMRSAVIRVCRMEFVIEVIYFFLVIWSRIVFKVLLKRVGNSGLGRVAINYWRKGRLVFRIECSPRFLK